MKYLASGYIKDLESAQEACLELFVPLNAISICDVTVLPQHSLAGQGMRKAKKIDWLVC
jgi:hypothetical protein